MYRYYPQIFTLCTIKLLKLIIHYEALYFMELRQMGGKEGAGFLMCEWIARHAHMRVRNI